MRRRQSDVSGVLLFNGRVYGSAAERECAVVVWRERRRRLLALLGYDEEESMR
jgi:hypothetical protein